MSIEGTAQTEYASLSGKIHTLVIDKSLSISGACADAKATGDAVEQVESQIDWAIKSAEEAEAAYKQAVEDMDELATEAAQKAVDALSAHELNAYEKEEVLSADTKALYGLSDDGVPDDILKSVHVPVGTIRTTIRTDLGENWLLCNGGEISSEDYPELFAVLSSGINKEWSVYSSKKGDGIDYGGGYFFSHSRVYEGSNVFYATDPLGTWTGKNVRNSDYYTEGVKYLNGQFVNYGNARYMRYASTPDGTWASTGDLVSSNEASSCTVYDAIYANGYYIACGKGPKYPYVFFSTAIDGTWLAVQSMGYEGYFRRAAYGNGKYVFVTSTEHSCYSPDLVSGLTHMAIKADETITLNDLIFANGYFLACGGSKLFYAADPAGTWTEVTLPITSANALYWGNGVIIVGGNKDFCYANSLTGDWTTVSIGSNAKGIEFANDTYYIGGSGNMDYLKLGGLPNITENNAYAYIKAKEG